MHPIAAAQMEYSPFALEIESSQTNFLQTARELGVKIVAYSPLGRGFLTGSIKSRDDLDESDNRRNHPRFSEEHFKDNLKLVETLSAIAEEKGCTPGQLSLAWVLAQGDGKQPSCLGSCIIHGQINTFKLVWLIIEKTLFPSPAPSVSNTSRTTPRLSRSSCPRTMTQGLGRPSRASEAPRGLGIRLP